MKREQLIDYVYLRLTPEQKLAVREELADDFVSTFNVLQLMEKRALGELNERSIAIMEDEIDVSNAKGHRQRRSISISMPSIQRRDRGGQNR